MGKGKGKKPRGRGRQSKRIKPRYKSEIRDTPHAHGKEKRERGKSRKCKAHFLKRIKTPGRGGEKEGGGGN